MSDSITSICCGFVVQRAVTTSCASNPRQIESQQQVHNRSPQQVVRQAASLTTSWTTCLTASPRQVHSKLHATISKSYNKSHNLLYDKSTLTFRAVINRKRSRRRPFPVVFVYLILSGMCQRPVAAVTGNWPIRDTNGCVIRQTVSVDGTPAIFSFL